MSSQRVNIRIRPDANDTVSILITDALLHALTTYTRAWVAFHHRNATPFLGAPERRSTARRSALDFAWCYRHTGRTRPVALTLSDDALTLAAAHAAVGLTFLMSHEIGHLIRRHIAPREGLSSCLDVGLIHRQEYEADLLAASMLANNPPALTRSAESMRILFELLELVAAGTPGDERTHPIAMQRLLAILAVLDPAERDLVLDALRHGVKEFWLLAAD